MGEASTAQICRQTIAGISGNCCALYEHAASLHYAQLRVACIQYIRDMFDAVSLSDGWAALSEEMRRPIVELGKPKAPARR